MMKAMAPVYNKGSKSRPPMSRAQSDIDRQNVVKMKMMSVMGNNTTGHRAWRWEENHKRREARWRQPEKGSRRKNGRGACCECAAQTQRPGRGRRTGDTCPQRAEGNHTRMRREQRKFRVQKLTEAARILQHMAKVTGADQIRWNSRETSERGTQTEKKAARENCERKEESKHGRISLAKGEAQATGRPEHAKGAGLEHAAEELRMVRSAACKLREVQMEHSAVSAASRLLLKIQDEVTLDRRALRRDTERMEEVSSKIANSCTLLEVACRVVTDAATCMACWSSEGESGERKTANAGYGRPAEEATAARKHAEMEGLACDTALRGRWRMRTQAGKDAACNGATGGGVGGSGEEAGTQPADNKKRGVDRADNG